MSSLGGGYNPLQNLQYGGMFSMGHSYNLLQNANTLAAIGPHQQAQTEPEEQPGWWEQISQVTRALIPDAYKLSLGYSYIGPTTIWPSTIDESWEAIGTDVDFVYHPDLYNWDNEFSAFTSNPMISGELADKMQEDSNGWLPFTFPSAEVSIYGGPIWGGNNLEAGLEPSLEGLGVDSNASLFLGDAHVEMNVLDSSNMPPLTTPSHLNPEEISQIVAVSFGFSAGFPDLVGDFSLVPTNTVPLRKTIEKASESLARFFYSSDDEPTASPPTAQPTSTTQPTVALPTAEPPMPTPTVTPVPTRVVPLPTPEPSPTVRPMEILPGSGGQLNQQGESIPEEDPLGLDETSKKKK